ncbi:MAG: hypothetical protein ACLFRI_06335 [Candidatus Izemoplasmataceae bacterium]
MKKLWVLGLLFLIIGCTNETEASLGVPKNIRYENEHLVWDSVPEATYYTISIDGIHYRASESNYDVFNLVNGSYTVRVKAHTDVDESIFSNVFTLVIDRAFDYPKNIRITNNTLHFDGTVDALNYRVYINDLSETISDTTYDLSTLDEDSLYQIQVSALYANGESIKTPVILHHTFSESLDTFEFEINKNRSTDGFINTEVAYAYEYFLFENTVLDEPFITFESDTMIIDHEFLKSLEAGSYTITLLLDEGYVLMTMTVLDEERPYMITPNTLPYEGLDLSFTFELFDGRIDTVSGLDIKEDDYTIEDSTLIISSDFIESVQEDDPDRSTIILSYTLVKDDLTIVGFIFIELP